LSKKIVWAIEQVLRSTNQYQVGSAEELVQKVIASLVHVDNAVSKTINLPEETSPEEIGQVFFLAHQLHGKGITVFRYQSREDQV